MQCSTEGSRWPDGTRTRRQRGSASDGSSAAIACKHGIIVVSHAVNDTVADAKAGRVETCDALILERLIAVVVRHVSRGAAEEVDVSPPGITTVSSVLATL